MEPKLPAPSIERMPLSVNYAQPGEILPVPPTPETGLEQHSEQFEQKQDASVRTLQQTTIVPTSIPLPIPTVTDDSAAPLQADDTPLVAGDDDLIEKEWVEKAKKIIVATRDDPHRRELEVGMLQADYLFKRYGKDLGASQ